MRNVLRAVWVVGMLAVLGILLHERGVAQQQLRPPMPPNLFTVHKLTDKLSIIAPSGPDMSQVGGNIGVFVTDEGVLVIDDNYLRQVRNGQTVELAEAVVAEIKKITNQPIRFVINTHHHGDHAGGNPVFAKLAPIFAQKNVRNRILAGYKNEKEPLGFDPMKALPLVTYDGELIFHMGGEEIHLYHPARAHTDGDSLVHFKNANIAHWGDAFVNNWVPVIDGSGSTLEWLQFIDRGIQLVGENAVMVPRTRCDRESRRCEAPAAVFHQHARQRAKGHRCGQNARAGDGRDYGARVCESSWRGGSHPDERRLGLRRAEGYSVTRIDFRKDSTAAGSSTTNEAPAGRLVTAIVNPVFPISSNASSSVASSPI